MRKTFISLIGLSLLMGLPAFADGGGCQLEELLSKSRNPAGVVISDHAYTVEEGLLFYQFPVSLEAGAEVRFEARRGDQTLLIEELFLIPENPEVHLQPLAEARSGGTVVEFLSIFPAERSRLQRGSANDEIEVSVFLKGELSETLSFGDFATRAGELQENLPIPHAISTRLDFSATDRSGPFGLSGTGKESGSPITKGACENACYAQSDYCEDQCVWVPNSGPCFAACADALDDCLFSCSGQCNPSTTTSTAYTLVSTQIIDSNPTCIAPGGGPNANLYQWARLKYRVTTTTTTTHANCTQTVSTTISYQYVYCWRYYSFSCFPWQTPVTATNIC